MTAIRALLFLVFPLLALAEKDGSPLWWRDNLDAWCIVPFDAEQRTPAQRAEMVVKLGLRKVAYDWREKHVAEFEEEIVQYQKHGVEFFAFWGVHPRAFELFEKYKLHPQVWLMAPNPQAATNDEKIRLASEALLPTVEETRKIGSKLALYNHGGWNGEPENMAGIAEYLRKHHNGGHVGIVYNFHHGHPHIESFAAKWKVMQPYLLAVNLNGMEVGGDAKGRKILHLGEGDRELEMMRVIEQSGWRGPVGIIDHREETDSEVTLRNNLLGLDWLRKELVKPGSGGPKPDFTAVARAAKRTGQVELFTGEELPKSAAVELPGREPLNPSAHPLHTQAVNRDRIYDFYAKQAGDWRENPRPLLPAYPGLDGGKQGHWGNQNEETWRDGRWNKMDIGPCMAGVFRDGKLTVAKAMCVRLEGPDGFVGCYDPLSDEWKAVWDRGFLKFSDNRHGLMDGLRMGGNPRPEMLESTGPPPRPRGRYRGYYRHGQKTVFAFDINGKESLQMLRVGNRCLILDTGEELREFTKGGPAQWPQVLETKGRQGQTIAGWPFVLDTLTLPFDNPWHTLFFAGGHDFFSNGDIALCTMTGDVWRVSGVDDSLSKLRWKRMAAGLHQPLGLVIVDDKPCVLGRDQITRLHDLNGDGEADFYECLTNDFDTPTGGHDYLCGLERDAAGNFYTASGNAGLLKISPGKKTEVIASGFRNPDGFGLSPKGVFTVPYSDGEWTPTSAIAQITPGGYYGYPGPKNGVKTERPLLWLPRGVDNSAGAQTWVPDKTWGALAGQMMHLSYGTGNAFIVLRQQVNNVWQGAAVPLPGDFNSGAHRGRFHPRDGHLYVSGMTGWGTYTPDDGCLQRLRYTGGPMHMPVAFEARDNGLLLTFSDALNATAGQSTAHFAQCWNYRYSAAYGSPELSLRHPDKPGHDVLEISGAHLLADGKQLFLEIPQLQPAGQIHVVVQPQPGVQRQLFLTTHVLGLPFRDFPGYKVIAKTSWVNVTDAATVVSKVNPFTEGHAGRALRVEASAGLQFATTELKVEAGERISLTFANPDVLPHNWVLLSPGSFEKVGDLANKLISDPQGFARHYVPDAPEVLAWIDMVNPGGEFTIHFDAPAKAGEYPFICTFPGHWMVMKGVLRVK